MTKLIKDWEGEEQPVSAHVVPRDGKKDLLVTGILFASVSNAPSGFSESERWKELNVYLSESGKVVYQKAGCSSYDGEHTRFAVHIFDHLNELDEHLGYDPLEKKLRGMIGLESFEDIK